MTRSEDSVQIVHEDTLIWMHLTTQPSCSHVFLCITANLLRVYKSGYINHSAPMLSASLCSLSPCLSLFLSFYLCPGRCLSLSVSLYKPYDSYGMYTLNTTAVFMFLGLLKCSLLVENISLFIRLLLNEDRL